MSELVKNRSELIFLYDVKDANPNGDPLDENRPRIDEETNRNIVTDVRLKRTIRDYLHDMKNEEIFVRQIELDDGSIQDAKLRAEDFLSGGIKKGTSLVEKKRAIDEAILNSCIDVRLFGATIPISGTGGADSSVTHTGPVQFKIGRSMHRVDVKHFRGTGAFASKKGATQATFREEDFVMYSLINFYGIINENVAAETKLTDEDVDKLLDAVWYGTKNLISRSKAGQMPRLLIRVTYASGNFHVGDLNSHIKLISSIEDEKIRDIADVQLDVTDLLHLLATHKSSIGQVEYKIDDYVRLLYEGSECTLADALSSAKITHRQLAF